jgi:hypothetical protein
MVNVKEYTVYTTFWREVVISNDMRKRKQLGPFKCNVNVTLLVNGVWSSADDCSRNYTIRVYTILLVN